MDVDVVESDGNDWYQEDGESEYGRNPESWQAESHPESAEVFAGRNEVPVYEESHGEEEGHAPKDNDVVENCPVRSIKCNL